MNYIKDYLLFDEAYDRKQRVTAVNGRVTAYMRKRWGINKVREDGDLHHSVDAVVVACITPGIVQTVTEYAKREENRYLNKDDAAMRERFPMPWPEFSTELDIRTCKEPKEMLRKVSLANYQDVDIDSIKPIFVSRMTKKKVTGQAHKETIRAYREVDGKMRTVTKTSIQELKLDKDLIAHIDEHIKDCEKEMDDDAESIITNQRYAYINGVVDKAVKKKPRTENLTASDKIDQFVTNRILALPIFAAIMWLMYAIAMGTSVADGGIGIGTFATDWTNDVLFGEIVPNALGGLLESIGVAGWLYGLIMDGIVAGVGAVLGFVPQMLVLFFLLSILEDVGYMARVAFIMDRIFRKFGLSGKSFIPMLVGTGCGVPGVMASRTIENERDRRMTIMTTCFIPCGAKMPIIGLIAGALFGGSSWVATSAYFIGFAAIIISGIILKKTKLFAGDPAPFVMELPAYHVPAWGNVLRATWERGWSFIKRAGTVILAATIILWFLQGFGFENGAFTMVEDQDNSILAIVASTISWIFIPQGFGNWRATVASISGLIAKENVVGTFGVLYHYADELSDNGDEIWPEVAASFTAISAYSFMIFNLLCAPCFAAMGAIKREMNNGKWTAIAIGYMCLFAYCASLVVYQIGGLITGEVGFNFFTIVAVAIIALTIYLLFRPNKYEGVNEVQFDAKKTVASH